MYFMRKGFADRGMEGFGIFFGALGIGNMFQSNQAYVQFNHVAGGGLDGLGWLVGLIMAAVVFSVIIGGIVQLGSILDDSHAFVFLICVPDILGLHFLAPVVKAELESHLARIESGGIKKYKQT